MNKQQTTSSGQACMTVNCFYGKGWMQKAICLWFAALTPHSMNCLELSHSESACYHQLNCMHATMDGPGVVITTASYLDWTVLQSGGSLYCVSWSHVTYSHTILLGCVIQTIDLIDLQYVHVTWSIAGRNEKWPPKSAHPMMCMVMQAYLFVFRRKWTWWHEVSWM